MVFEQLETKCDMSAVQALEAKVLELSQQILQIKNRESSKSSSSDSSAVTSELLEGISIEQSLDDFDEPLPRFDQQPSVAVSKLEEHSPNLREEDPSME